MMKRISAVMVALVMALCTSIPAFAQSGRLIDEAYLLSSSEATDIEAQLDDASLQTGWDIVIYTNENDVSDYDMEDYCNEYYDNSSFDYDGVMLTVDMASREMFVLTKGEAMEYFTDQRVDQILDDIVYYLSDDEYVSACEAFINDVLLFYSDGIPEYGDYDNVYIAPEDSYEDENVNPFIRVLKEYGIIIGIVSVVVAVLAVVFIYLRYKNHGKSGTYNLEENSVTHLTQREDIFITKSISVTTISSGSSGGSSGGGGGGGSSHGGGGRSF
jgi:uncharacterized protein